VRKARPRAELASVRFRSILYRLEDAQGTGHTVLTWIFFLHGVSSCVRVTKPETGVIEE
jgi:hypothetical protein